MKENPIISATKTAALKVTTTIKGNGGETLEMLAVLNCAIAELMLENGAPPDLVKRTLAGVATKGAESAVAIGAGGMTQ